MPALRIAAKGQAGGMSNTSEESSLIEVAATEAGLEGPNPMSEPATPVLRLSPALASTPVREPKARPSAIDPPSKLNQFIAQIGHVGRKTMWQMYFSPSVSYRRLVGQASRYTYPYNGFPYSANYGFARDVKDAVRHRPSVGMEIGTALLYPLNRSIRLKGWAAVQL
jgi:hypothetical protein